MSRLFYHTCQDNLGNLLFDVSGTMRIAGSGTLATIYGDEALTVILPNPMTNHPSYGSFKCFLPAGDFDFYLSKSGYTFETLTGVQGHGTMAQQDAHAVDITGGTATLAQLGLATALVGGHVLDALGPVQISGITGIDVAPLAGHSLRVGGLSRFDGLTGFGVAPAGGNLQSLLYDKTAQTAIQIRNAGSDVGGGMALQFQNVAGTQAGSITVTAAATAYNTSSDARLKHDVDDLTGELALIQALRPVSFRWIADESPGVGFLAQEVAAHVQGVITGEADAVDDAGGIIPQQIDHSKLVPWLVGAIKTLAARVAVLEDALGV